MASVTSFRTKAVGIVAGAAAAGALALFAAGPAHAVSCSIEQSPYCESTVTTGGTTTTTTTTTTVLEPVVGGEQVESGEVAAEQESSDTLPFTGVEVGGLVVLGGGLIAGGIFLSVAARRKAESKG